MKKFLRALAFVASLLATPALATVTTTATSVSQSANGATTVWSYSFPIPYQSDGVTPAVLVQTQDPTGTVTNVASNLYAITGVGTASGGAVTYPLSGSPLATGYHLIITRQLAYIQPTAVSNSAFYPHTVESVADNLDMQIQQLANLGFNLPHIPDGTLLANISGSSASPLATSPTGLFDYVFGSTSGDILVRGASTWSAGLMTGDCTLSGFGITCLDTNGTPFGTFATQNYATPPVIGGTTPNTVNAAALTASGTITFTGMAGGGSQCLQVNNAGVVAPTGLACGNGGGGGGSVTSVAVTAASGMSVSGSPITTSGTFTFSWSNESANRVFIGPTSGGAATPTWRALVGADLPNPSASTLGGTESKSCSAHQWLNTISTSGVPACAQPGFSDLSGNIAVSQMDSGTAASSATFWRGDGHWASPPGSVVAQCYFTISGGAIASQTCTNATVSRAGTGLYVVTYSVSAGTNTYIVNCTAAFSSLAACMEDTSTPRTTAAVRVRVHNGGGAIDASSVNVLITAN